MSLSPAKENYLLLSQSISEMIFEIDIFGEESEEIQDIFVSALCEVLKLALDINMTQEAFDNFMISTNYRPSRVEAVRFIEEVTENERTYDVVNYFLLDFYCQLIALVGEQILSD